MMANFPNWVDHILAFLYCVIVPGFAAWQRSQSQTQSPVFFTSEQKKKIYISGSFSLMLLALAILAVWRVFERPVYELGFSAPVNFQSWWWLVVIFIFIYIADAAVTLSSKNEINKAIEQWKKRTPFLPTKKSELPEYFLLCLSAGVFEEIIYRGYLVTYCQYLFAGLVWQQEISIILPAFIFSVAHFYQGAKAVLKIFILAIFFGYIFVFSGSLLVVMLLHFLVDAAGGLLTIKYMRGHLENFSTEYTDQTPDEAAGNTD
jgi:membrane protease YdiL (CAAX protease family)